MTKETQFTQRTVEFSPADFGLIGEAMIGCLTNSLSRERKIAFAGVSQMLKSTRLIPRTAVIQVIALGSNLNGKPVLLVQYHDNIRVVEPDEVSRLTE